MYLYGRGLDFVSKPSEFSVGSRKILIARKLWVSGGRVSTISSTHQFDDLVNYQPTLALIIFGANDVLSATTNSTGIVFGLE